MTFSRSKKWRDWRQHIAVRCDALTRGMTPPIPLQEIFTQCHVKKVVFQPLLLEAAIAVDDDGFVVFVNCDEKSRESYRLAYDADRQKGRYLPARVRFSLAHEFVHTFFYDTDQRPYTNRLIGTSAKETESLESACNFGASHLLLPTRLLKADTYKKDVLTVDGILDLAKRYQVSNECLIKRLEHLEDWTPKRGVVAFVRKSTDGYHVKAVAMSAAVRGLFKNGIESIFGSIPFKTMESKNNGVLDFDITYPKQVSYGIAKCRMEYRQVASTPTAFVLAVSVDDRPLPITKHKHSDGVENHIAKLKHVIKQRGARRSGSVSF